MFDRIWNFYDLIVPAALQMARPMASELPFNDHL